MDVLPQAHLACRCRSRRFLGASKYYDVLQLLVKRFSPFRLCLSVRLLCFFSSRQRLHEFFWGHVSIFLAMPPANTLMRWRGTMRFRPHSADSTILHLGPTGSSLGSPHRLRPGNSLHTLRIPPRGGHPVLKGFFFLGQRGVTPAFRYQLVATS